MRVFRTFIYALCFIIALAGVGMVITAFVLDYQAQIAFDGQYLTIRRIYDLYYVYKWGGIGAIALGASGFLFTFFMDLGD